MRRNQAHRTPLGLEVALGTLSDQVSGALVHFAMTILCLCYWNCCQLPQLNRKIFMRPSLYLSLLLASLCHLSKVVYHCLLVSTERPSELFFSRAGSDPLSCTTFETLQPGPTFSCPAFLPAAKRSSFPSKIQQRKI